MKPAEHNTKTPTDATGFFATLCRMLYVKGSGASKAGRRDLVVSLRRSGRIFPTLSRLKCCVPALLCAVVGLLACSPVPALAAAPEVPEVRVESVTAATAIFYGVLNPNAAGVAGTYEFFYKASKTGACEGGSHTPASPGISLGAQHEELPAEPVSGLQANTEYAVCLLAETSPSEKTQSAPVTFTTAPETPETLSPAKSVTATTAVLEGVLNPKAQANAGWYFDYSTEAKCTENPVTSPMEPEELVKAKKESKEVSELQPNRKYEFCLVAYNAAGAQSTVGNEVALTTEPAPPKIDRQSASTNSTEATLEAQVNPNNQETHAYLQYSTSGMVNGSGALTTATKLTTIDLGEGYGDTPVGPETLTGLPAGTTFYYQAVASNATGTSYGTVQSITTVPTPSTDPVTAIAATTATFNGHLTLNPVATSYSFDYKLGSECTGESSTQSTAAASASVSTRVTGLQPDRLYTVCLVTTNAFGSQVGPSVSFKTLPEIYVTDVGSSSATLHVVLDPEGVATTYSFQFGTGSSYGSETPQASAGTGAKPLSFEAHIQNLNAGTVYHFRVIVNNASHETIEAANATFTTRPESSPFTLPDGRQWELVSPPDKQSGSIDAITGEGGLIQAAENGDAITYVTNNPIVAHPLGNRATEDSQVLSRRGAEGWSTEDITTPHNEYTEWFLGVPTEYKLFSPDLSLGLVEPKGETPLPPLPEGAERTIYLRNDSECEPTPTQAIPPTCYTALVTRANVEVPGSKIALPESDREALEGSRVIFQGASPDLSHVVFSDFEPLTTDAAKGQQDLYEWSGGRLSLVSVLPDGEPVSAGLGEGQHNLVRNAVSNDGSRVIWKATGSAAGLYLRDMERKETVEVDSEGHFATANSEDSKLFFTTGNTQGDASAGDLYVFEVTSGEGEPLAGHVTNLTGEGAGVQGEVIGASEDGSYVYFVANGVLGDAAAHDASQGNCKSNNPGGMCNLYVEHQGGGGWEAPEFIATLSGADNPDWSVDGKYLTGLTARVSPDGRWLAFMSDRSLTGYDTTDVNSGEADEEVYLFDTATGRLVCASCNPTGQRPVGVYDPGSGEREPVPLLVDEHQVWETHWLAGSVPGWTSEELRTAIYQSRYLSNNGRLFFDSPDALVSADVNQKEDVYEFEPAGVGGCSAAVAGASEVFEPGSGGCVGLISSGTSSGESAFLDAGVTGGRDVEGNEGGGDVFFLTASQLAPQDEDRAYDVYDAHECTESSPCVTSTLSASTPPCTTADSCRAASSPQPSIYGAGPSETFAGPGNLAPPGGGAPNPVKPKPKVLTRAQKLANALKACHRKKGRQRAKCEKTAHKEYGAKAAAKKASDDRRATR
jgi:hypothetical protein